MTINSAFEMGYVLNAFIARTEVFESSSIQWKMANVTNLTQGFSMVPLTEELVDEIEGSTIEIKEEISSAFYRLSGAASLWGQNLSENQPVAYIEIDLSGGVGSRAAIAWDKGKIVFGPQHDFKGDLSVTNSAFRYIGVNVEGTFDEFDALGLGRHRHMEDWLSSDGE